MAFWKMNAYHTIFLWFSHRGLSEQLKGAFQNISAARGMLA